MVVQERLQSGLRPSPDDVGGQCHVDCEDCHGNVSSLVIHVKACITAPNGETMYLYGKLPHSSRRDILDTQAEAVRLFMEQHRA
jgi:hypothetical protein